ncbi:MAG: hypothetical protein M1834_009338 [Cirrosporium novae-zelandiae]|nr:MAG: hypothetical protein M1834_009338 [Cirrosporium novae-zelandiae]
MTATATDLIKETPVTTLTKDSSSTLLAPGAPNVPVRLRSSCETCRASKTRCLPDKGGGGHCERCTRLKRDCIFKETQARITKPRPKQRKARVAEMEQKLDSIVNMLAAGNHGNQISSTRNPFPSALKDDSQRTSTLTPSPSYTPPTSSCNISRAEEFHTSGPSPEISDTILRPPLPSLFEEDVIQKGIINFESANLLLQMFHLESTNFPFILLPPNTSLQSLRIEKPFLLLSILAMASQDKPNLHALLESELRRVLGTKVIVKGEKSLDLLQGLMVYLAWYHYHFTLQHQQLYQLMQLAVAMCVDLEIGKPRNASIAVQETPYEIETKRTFIGCYYISSCLSIALRRANTMQYTKYLEDCCRSFSQAPQVPSDKLLIHYIRLQNLASEIARTFGYDGSEVPLIIGRSRIKLLVNNFRSQLRQLQDSFPPEASVSVPLMTAHHNVCIYVHEIGLHVEEDAPHIFAPRHDLGDPDSWDSSTERLEVLIDCLESVKRCLDYFLSLNLAEVRRLTMMDALRLTYSIIALAKISGGTVTQPFDSAQLQKSANFTYYLDALILRMTNLVDPAVKMGDLPKDIFWRLKSIFELTKLKYEQQLLGGGSSSSLLTADGQPHPKDFSPFQLVRKGEDGLSSDDENLPDFLSCSTDAFWSEFLAGWPTSLDGFVSQSG